MAGSALVGTACVFGGEGNQDLSDFFEEPPSVEEPQATPTDEAIDPVATDIDPNLLAELLDLSIAPRTALEAVQKFYALVAANRFEDAYRIVSLEARETISVDDFATRYRDIWEEATITGVAWEVIPPPGENVAGLEGGVISPKHPFLAPRMGHRTRQFSDMPYLDAWWAQLPGQNLQGYVDATHASWALVSGTEVPPTARALARRYQLERMIDVAPTMILGERIILRYLQATFCYLFDA